MSSVKSFNILKILNTRINTSGIKQFLVLWENNTNSWVNEIDIASYSISNFNKITNTNAKINSNQQNAISPPVISTKKALVYSRTSPKAKTSIQQNLSNLNINSASSNGSSSNGSSSNGSSSTLITSVSLSTTCDSIKTQEHYCLKYCIDNNIEVEFIASDENVSSRNMNNLKKELGFFKEQLSPNHNCIIIYTPDRLSRHSAKGQSFLEEMSEQNIDVHFVKEGYVYNKDTPSHIKHQIVSLLNNAEFLSNQTSERVKNTIKRKKAEGHHFGRPRYGYEIKMINGIRKLKPHKEQQKIISNISNLYKKYNEQNNKPIKQIIPLISNELNKQQVTNTRNLPFTKSMLTTILKREQHTLLYNHNKNNDNNDNLYVNLLGDNLNAMNIKGKGKGKEKEPTNNGYGFFNYLFGSNNGVSFV